MDLKRLAVFGFVLFCFFTVLVTAVPGQITKFLNLSMADGLSMSTVICIDQDQYGFMWIGTSSGLNIYDGEVFRHFLHDNSDKDTNSRSINDIITSGDTAWLATQDGLFMMDVRTKSYKKQDIGENKNIRTLSLDKANNKLWVGTNTGLIELSINSGVIREFNTANSNISHNLIRALYQGSDGALWIGTYNKLNKLAPNSSLFKIIDLDLENGQNQSNQLILSVRSKSVINDSLLLVGTQRDGLVILNQKSNKKTFFNQQNSLLQNNVVKTTLVTKSDKVWLGTDFGLAELDTSMGFTIHLHNPFIDNSLANSIIWDIFEDQSGALWLGTNNGLSILFNKKNRFNYHPIAIKNQNNFAGCEVRAITRLNTDNLLLSTQNGLIQYEKDDRNIQILKGPNNLLNDTKGSLVDSKGRIWIASNGGVSLIDINGRRKNFTKTVGSSLGLRSNYIANFLELEDGTILINAQEGLHKVLETNDVINFEFIGDFWIRASGNEYMWAWDQSTVYRVDPVTFERKPEFSCDFENNNGVIQSMLFGENNKIWVGYGNGLVEYNQLTGQMQFHELLANMSYPLINLLQDFNGNIWASSYSSILKFDVNSKEFEIYPSGDEIPINRFMHNSSLITEQGEMIFGGHDGFVTFFPENITKSNFFPPVRLTGLRIMNEEVLTGTIINGKKILNEEIAFIKELKLDYRNNTFSIEFSSLYFVNRRGLQYSFILEGKDETWNFVNNHFGSATYSKLSAGQYIFRVRGTNIDGAWNSDEILLNIIIKPPLWASPGFIIGYLSFIFLIIYALMYYLVSRTRWRNQVKIIRLEKEHANDIARKRQQFLTNIAHEFRTPLSLIIGPIEKLNRNTTLDKKSKRYLQLIENNARRLLWLNNQLLDFRKIEKNTIKLEISEFEIGGFVNSLFLLFQDMAEGKGIEYNFVSEFPELHVNLDIRKLETILFNLLSNAFKFTPENGTIRLSIKYGSLGDNMAIIIEVKDSGIGISSDDQKKVFERFYQAKVGTNMKRGSGIGLTMVNEYVKIHGGEIELASSIGNGSTFTIILPLQHGIIIESSEPSSQEPIKPSINQLKASMAKTQGELSQFKDEPYLLLVEDDKEFADFLFMSLSEKYNVFLAYNGKEALKSVSIKIPALVISDITMPEMTGIEFTKKFKSNPKTAHIPLILMSGENQKERQIEGLQSGADAYIVKPFALELLELRIANFLKHNKQIIQYSQLDQLSKPKEVKISTQDEKMLSKVVKGIEKLMSDPDLDVEKLVVETGFSYSYLYRKIKKLTGQSVNGLIREMRIRRAAQILSSQNVSVADAMHEIGFTSHSYFSKCFRKVYHLSPTEFMNKN
jgi:signal transduction histidine kinase/ligand-binding sensor domain-containing protein/DNA-binding response OmpR family regulator